MKFDKIVFSCSEYFAPFWNIQARVWNKMGVEPVCLYFSDTKDGMSEEHGEVILKEADPQFGEDSDILQITMSKFWHPTTEPDTTWLIGDIDMLPMTRDYFIHGDKIQHGLYANLNFSGIFQSVAPGDVQSSPNLFAQNGSKTMGGFDLPGHYHLATGRTFKDVIFPDKQLEDSLREIVDGDRYGHVGTEEIHKRYWCAEENYTSEKIHEACVQRQDTKLGGQIYDNRMQRVDRSFWQQDQKRYAHAAYSLDDDIEDKFVDIHCHRPYHEQEEHMLYLLDKARML